MTAPCFILLSRWLGDFALQEARPYDVRDATAPARPDAWREDPAASKGEYQWGAVGSAHR